ncbi:MAG: YbbR-like domain-containing protein [Oscillospiraceae bacterium]
MKNRLGSILLSIVIAFGLWLYVITYVSPNSEETYYNIPVVLEGESVLNERGLMCTSTSSSTVSLQLAGARSDLIKVNQNNITVKANLSAITEPGQKINLRYTISYPGNVAQNAFETLSQSDFYVDVEYRRVKDVPVVVQYDGTRSEDYLYDTENVQLDYSTVNVIGPASVADKIRQAVIEVDLTDQVESISESYRYTLCDAEGNPVDAAEITTDVEEIHLDMKIQRIKELQLVAQVTYGGGATEENTTITVNPASIRVTGSDAALAELGDSYTLAEIDLRSVEKSQNMLYTINLPDGITNQTGVNEATVSIQFSGLSTREYTVANFEAINVPEGMEVEIINASLTVRVRGAAGQISQLTGDDIKVVVDFSNAVAGTATYKASITFGEGFTAVGAVMGPYSVSATVKG